MPDDSDEIRLLLIEDSGRRYRPARPRARTWRLPAAAPAGRYARGAACRACRSRLGPGHRRLHHAALQRHRRPVDRAPAKQRAALHLPVGHARRRGCRVGPEIGRPGLHRQGQDRAPVAGDRARVARGAYPPRARAARSRPPRHGGALPPGAHHRRRRHRGRRQRVPDRHLQPRRRADLRLCRRQGRRPTARSPVAAAAGRRQSPADCRPPDGFRSGGPGAGRRIPGAARRRRGVSGRGEPVAAARVRARRSSP